MKILKNILGAAVIIAAASFLIFHPVRAEEKKDPCASIKDKARKTTCQNTTKISAYDIAISRLIVDINYSLTSSFSKDALKASQDTWYEYMDKACIYETSGNKVDAWAPVYFDFCKISYMEQRIKMLESYRACIGKDLCPK